MNRGRRTNVQTLPDFSVKEQGILFGELQSFIILNLMQM